MPRPQPTFTSDMMPMNEQQDRDYVRSLGDCVYPPDIFQNDANSEADFLTRSAGLVGGWRALGAEMLALGKVLPGHRFVVETVKSITIDASPGSPNVASGAKALGRHAFESSDRLPLLIRAWALEYAPQLIDPNAAGPPAQVAQPWW